MHFRQGSFSSGDCDWLAAGCEGLVGVVWGETGGCVHAGHFQVGLARWTAYLFGRLLQSSFWWKNLRQLVHWIGLFLSLSRHAGQSSLDEAAIMRLSCMGSDGRSGDEGYGVLYSASSSSWLQLLLCSCSQA